MAPSKELGTRLELVLVDGESAEKLIRNLPLIPLNATVAVHKPNRSNDYAHQWHGDLPTYRHCEWLKGGVRDRFVSLRCFTNAPRGDADSANQRFENWRDLFEAMLGTVWIEGRYASQPDEVPTQLL